MEKFGDTEYSNYQTIEFLKNRVDELEKQLQSSQPEAVDAPDFGEVDKDLIRVDLEDLKKCGWEYAKRWIEELKEENQKWANAYHNKKPQPEAVEKVFNDVLNWYIELPPFEQGYYGKGRKEAYQKFKDQNK